MEGRLELLDHLEEALQPCLLLRQLDAQLGEVALVIPPRAVGGEEIRPGPLEPVLGAAQDEVVAVPDQLEVGGIELVGLDQDLLPDADLAEIVQQAGVAELPHLLGREPDHRVGPVAGPVHRLGQADRHRGHPLGMARRGWVALLDGRHRRADEALEQPLDGFVELAVLDRDGRLPRQRLDQLHRVRAEGDDLAGGLRRIVEDGGGVALAVDQLQHADYVALVILHRDDEHRLGAVAVPLVERPVERVGDVAGQHVDVVDDQGLALGGGVARQRRVVDRNREFDERNVGPALVLAQLEPQLSAALLVGLHDVEAAGVGVRDAPGLVQDEFEQGVVVLLGGEPHPDVAQLGQLAHPRGRLVAGQERLAPGGRGTEGGTQRQQQEAGAGGRREKGRQPLGRQSIRNIPLARSAEGHDGGARLEEPLQAAAGEGGTIGWREQEDGGAAVVAELVPGAEGAALDLVRCQRVGDRGRVPPGGVQEEELHRPGFLPS